MGHSAPLEARGDERQLVRAMSSASRAASVRKLHFGEDLRARDLPADECGWLRQLGGPTLLLVPGRDRSRTRIAATLLHGNEPSGLRAIHRWLATDPAPAVDALLLIGAVETALARPVFTHRSLPGQRDLNRCWLPPFEGPEGALARSVLDAFGAARVEALVDIHNNSGHNPAYGVAPRAGLAETALTSLFSDRLVHTTIELGTLVEATQDDFPSVTIECGRAGDPTADDRAFAGLAGYLGREKLDLSTLEQPVTLLVDPVRVCVGRGVDIDFGDCPVEGIDLTVSRDVDRHNFELLAPGTAIGWVGERDIWPIRAECAQGRDRSRELFQVCERELVTRTSMIPVMMTTDRRSALADCLFYAVQPSPRDPRSDPNR